MADASIPSLMAIEAAKLAVKTFLRHLQRVVPAALGGDLVA